LKQLSFHYDVKQFGRTVFRPGKDLQTAQDNVPVVGELVRRMNQRGRVNSPPVDTQSTWPALVLFTALSVVILRVRTQPE
jgi:hypothetical protein